MSPAGSLEHLKGLVDDMGILAAERKKLESALWSSQQTARERAAAIEALQRTLHALQKRNLYLERRFNSASANIFLPMTCMVLIA